jgi:hypothetical protein
MSSAHLSCLVTACKSESMARCHAAAVTRGRAGRGVVSTGAAPYPRTRAGLRRTRAGAGRPSPRTGAGRITGHGGQGIVQRLDAVRSKEWTRCVRTKPGTTERMDGETHGQTGRFC